ncbi:MAG: pyridoxamine 5'-phosphate oxidase family protein [Bullifex sp.]
MRRKDREIKDIDSILKRTRVLRLALREGEGVYIVPLHFGYEHEGDTYTFWMHSASEGHKLDLIRENSKACFEIDTDEKLILTEKACGCGALFSSVIAGGHISIADTAEEKMKGLSVLMEHQSGRPYVITEEMCEGVTVLKFTAGEISAKARIR